MMKLKKGFAVAMAAGVLTTGGLGVQASVFSATAFAQGGEGPLDQGGPGGQDEAESVVKPQTYLGSDGQYATNNSLVIHKFSNNTPGVAGDGAEKADVSGLGKALGGAKFKIEKVDGFDLTTAQNWKDAEAFVKQFQAKKNDINAAVQFVKNDKGLSDEKIGITSSADDDTKGKLTFDDLARGLYLVQEIEAPADHNVSAEPFLVTLPLTKADGTGWSKTVHVYPKNSKKDVAKKTVKDAAAEAFVAGDENKSIEYTIESQLQDGKNYDQYVVTDFYPSARLTLVQAGAQVASTDVVVKVGNTVVSTDDYVVSDAEVTGTGLRALKVNFTDFTEINKNKTAKLTVTPKFKVLENTEGAQADAIVNKFKVVSHRKGEPPFPPKDPTAPNVPQDPNNPDVPPEGPTPGNPPFPKSYYGNVKINKTDTANEEIAKENNEDSQAVFDLYRCTKTGNDYALADSDVLLKQGIKDDPSDPNKPNLAEIKGLLANDYRNGKYFAGGVKTEGADAATAASEAYCLVETKAPKGYELAAKPFGFQVLVGSDPNAEGANPTVSLKDFQVVDTKPNFDLPLTGGKGVFALLLAGAAFLVLGRGYSVYAGRRKDA